MFHFENPEINIDPTWTLFLDRDGTINKRKLGGYIQSWDEFEFLPMALEGIADMTPMFARIIIVTNQQGIGKGLMSHEVLADIHRQMLERVVANHGYVDQVYYCPQLAVDDPLCRKPNPGMALQAAQDYPEIDFRKSIMVGDTESDMAFGRQLGMTTALIQEKHNHLVRATLRINTLADLPLYLNYNAG